MELFSITCTTCKSRLKVRDQAAIGQILACPKCGGMVMVRPPDEPPSQAPSHSQDSQVTVTGTLEMARPAWDRTRGDSAFDDVDELLGEAPPRQPVPSHATPDSASGARPRFVGAPPSSASPPQKQPDAQAAALAAAAASLAPPPPGEAALSMPPVDWVAPSPWRYWLLMAGSVAVGIVVAFAAVSVAIHFFRNPPRGLGNRSTAAPAVAGHAAGDRAAVPATPVREVVAPLDDVPPIEDRNTADRSSVSAGNPDGPTEVTSATDAPGSDVEPETTDSPESDPLGIVRDPETMPAPQPGNPNDPLARFDRLIGGGEEDPLVVVPEPGAGTEPDGPIPALDTAPSRATAPRPPPREVDVAERLADPLPGIETSSTPLADYLQLISNLSTIPITLEPDALCFARATAETQVVVREANTTVGDALTAALRPLGLEYAATADQLIVRLQERVPFQTITHPVHDLTEGDEAQLVELAELLPALVEPQTWNKVDDEGEGAAWLKYEPADHSLAIHHRRAVQAQVLIALEKLRSARGLPRVVRLDAPPFRLDTRSSLARARLETPVSLNFQQPTRLVTIAERLGESADVRLLFDWQGLAEEQWNSDAMATLLANNQPLEGALDALLAPLDLTWRIVDERTIQVVTHQRLGRQLDLEVYKVGDLVADDLQGERLLANLRAALELAPATEGSSMGVLHFDPEGRCLVAALSQPQQRKLEALLAKWRATP